MIAQQENSWSQFYTNVDVYLLASGHLIMYLKICFDVLAYNHNIYLFHRTQYALQSN